MAHSNTILHDLLKFIPRHEFEALVRKHNTGRKPRTFSWWNQFMHLISMQLLSRDSLRDGISSLESRKNHLYHLGCRPVARSTFADANKNRPAAMFNELFQRVYQRCAANGPGHKFPFKNKLYSLDGSLIKLCLSLFPWADYNRTKGAVKMHTLLDHDGYLPAFVAVSHGRKSELEIARTLKLLKGSIVAMDRGFFDYKWFASLNEKGVFFVTRPRKNAKYRVVDRRKVNKKQGLTSDQSIVLTGTTKHVYQQAIRRIGYCDPETKKHYVFWTNNFCLSAKTIADIYKERWQIELFFKWIKQNLKIKAFIGNSMNAVMTQIYVALIAYLLLAYVTFQCRLNITMQKLLRLLQVNLFRKMTLMELIKPPDTLSKNINQLELAIA